MDLRGAGRPANSGVNEEASEATCRRVLGVEASWSWTLLDRRILEGRREWGSRVYIRLAGWTRGMDKSPV